MPDPISTIIIAGVAGAAGGAGGKFVERAWSSGEKWLKSFYADHNEKAQLTAAENTNDFLARLAKRVNQVEEQEGINSSIINAALEDPSFSVLLRKGMLGAAQTSSENKHDILAVLLAERLKEPSESLAALAAPLACEAISALTLNQLKILGLQVAYTYYHPIIQHFDGMTRDQFIQKCDEWLAGYIAPVSDAKIEYLDINHLEAISCAQRGGATRYDLNSILSSWKCKDYNLTIDEFWKMKSAVSLHELWDAGLETTLLTSTGTLIGIYMLQTTAGKHAILTRWKKG